MSHWVITLVAGCSDYSFLWPPEREKEMDRVEVSMLQWQARFILQVGHERSCIATMVSNWAMMQRNLEALCRALQSLDPVERSVEVKWPFRGFTARYDKFQRNKWLLARQRAHGEGGSCALFVGFFWCFMHFLCPRWIRKLLWTYPKSFARNMLWTTVIYCGCTRLWDSSSQVSSFWGERVSNSPKRSDREEPCSSYRTLRGPLNIKTSLKKTCFWGFVIDPSCHDVVLHGWQGRDPSIWTVLSMVVQCFYVAVVLGILDSLQDLRSRESSRPATADAGFQHLDRWHRWHGWQMFWVFQDV